MQLLIEKSEKNKQLVFNAIKKQILKHLEKLEVEETANLQKAFSEFIAKGGKGYPVGTIREWKGKKFIKTAPGKWRPKYDGETRGAKLSVANLKKKIKACNTAQEMMQIVLENRDRFSDATGNPLPFVQDLSKFISQTQDEKFGSDNNSIKAKENDNNTNPKTNLNQKDVSLVKNVLTSKKSAWIKNNKLGDVELAFNKYDLGLKHIINRRFGELTKQKNSTLTTENAKTRISALLCLLIDTIRDGETEPQTRPKTWIAKKNGITAIIKDDKGKFICTGFEDNNKKEASTESINAVIAEYGATPEFLDIYAQVGAVIASSTNSITQNKSEVNGRTRSEAMMGNQNAKKLFKKQEETRAKQNERRAKAGLKEIGLFERESALEDSTWDPNSEDYRYRDTGYIAGSKKELAQNYIKRMAKEKKQVIESDIDWSGLEENSRLAESLITKSNIFGEVDWETLKKEGMSGGAAFLIDRIYASVGQKPIDNAEARRKYVIAINGLRHRLEKCKTFNDVSDAFDEIFDELQGNFIEAKNTKKYQEVAKKYAEITKIVLNKKTKAREFSIQKRDSLFELDYYKRSLIKKYFRLNKDRYREDSWDRTLEKITDDEKEKVKVLETEYNAKDEQYKKYLSDNNYIGNSDERRIEYSGVARYIDYPEEKEQIRLELEANRIMQEEGQRLILENPLYGAWVSLGDRFLKLRHSKTFLNHKSDARRGKYDDWAWAEKEVIKTGAPSKKKARFELYVASQFDRKGGKNVKVNSTMELKKMFNLRDIQSGNWVLKDPASAKFHVDKCCEGFSDLCDITGIPENLISLNGRLALAIGARGKMGAVAHYEPIQRVINITKMKGGGSLAHEWFHAFDNLISEAMQGGNINQFLTNPYANLNKKQSKLLDEYVQFKNSNGYTEAYKAFKLRNLKAEMKKANCPIPDENGNEEFVLSVKYAFDNLVKAMTEGTVPLKENVTYTDKDYESAVYNIENHQSPFVKKIKEVGNLEDAIKHINEQYKNATSKKVLKNKSDWIRAACAYYDGKKTGGTVAVDSGKTKSKFFGDAKAIDGDRTTEYWSSTHEMAARAFSAYIDDSLRANNRVNDYLAFKTTNDFYQDKILGDQAPYPEGEERKRINEAFKNLFSVVNRTGAIRKALYSSSLSEVKKLEQSVKKFERKTMLETLNKNIDRLKVIVLGG